MTDKIWHDVTRALPPETMVNFALSGNIADDLLVGIFNYDSTFDGLTDNQKIAYIMRKVLEYGIPDDYEIKETLEQFDNWVKTVKDDYPQQYAREKWGDRSDAEIAVAVSRAYCIAWQEEYLGDLIELIK